MCRAAIEKILLVAVGLSFIYFPEVNANIIQTDWKGRIAECAENELVIGFRNSDQNTLNNVLNEYDFKIIERIDEKIVVVKPDWTILNYNEIANNVLKEQEVVFVNPNFNYKPCAIDPDFSVRPWGRPRKTHKK